MHPHDLEFLGRVAVAAVIGYVIGWERSRRGSQAGARTFALVTSGAATFTGVGVLMFPASAEKVIAGVVTGIGFLGAGLIMRSDGGEVHGLTTAAALWATAALGVAAGTGELVIAILLTALGLVVLEAPRVPGLRWLEDLGHPEPTIKRAAARRSRR